jgi:hypothetical protein
MLKVAKAPKPINPALLPISIAEFLDFYNSNLPVDYPRASMSLLKKFQETHAQLFKNGDRWSLDLHRKKVFEWLPRNSKIS